MKRWRCNSCNKQKTYLVTAYVNGKYYPKICQACLGNDGYSSGYSSGYQSYDRRRQYEDYAQDTIQPYNAHGPNIEFARLYPARAAKVFPPDVLAELKRKM